MGVASGGWTTGRGASVGGADVTGRGVAGVGDGVGFGLGVGLLDPQAATSRSQRRQGSEYVACVLHKTTEMAGIPDLRSGC